MRLVSFETECQFEQEIQVPSLSQRVHRAITGKTPPQLQEPSEPGVSIRSIKRKLSLLWDTDSCSINVEYITSPDDCIRTIVSLLETINTVAPIDQLKRRTIITEWLLPTPNYDFVSLQQKYREAMITQQFVQDGTFDSSIILDIKVKNWTLHHQSGAMGVKQLLDDYLIFKPDNVPKVFLFLLASITEKKVIQYSREEMYSFLVKSFDICKSHSDAFERIWEGIL